MCKMKRKQIEAKTYNLKPFGEVIQVCPVCGKVDIFRGHEKECDPEYETARREAQEYYD